VQNEAYVFGRRDKPGIPELRSFLDGNGVVYRWFDVDRDPLVGLLGSPEALERLRLPAVLDGTMLEAPESYAEAFATPPAHIGADEPYLEAAHWRSRLADRLGLPTSPFLLESRVPGVFVAGDVRRGSTKRVASAAS
jgi:hypothetical protein